MTNRTLAQRAQAHADGEPEGSGETFRMALERMQPEFQMAMPRGHEAQQLVRDALTVTKANPELLKCEAVTLLGSLMTCAQLGLRPGVLGHAWIVPFKDNATRKMNAQLIIGYQGLCDLAYRSGMVQSIIARTVYEGDDFDVKFGTDEYLTHRPNRRDDDDAGTPTDYYVVVKTTMGGTMFWTMTHPEMLRHRERHGKRAGGYTKPWRDNFEPMAHKTCLHKIARWIPRSPELQAGMAADEGVRLDLRPDVRPEEATQRVTVTREDQEPAPAGEEPTQSDAS
jgi:recombination protein RecT